jgi:hypothetical protein
MRQSIFCIQQLPDLLPFWEIENQNFLEPDWVVWYIFFVYGLPASPKLNAKFWLAVSKVYVDWNTSLPVAYITSYWGIWSLLISLQPKAVRFHIMDWFLTSQNLGMPDSGNSENLHFAFVHTESMSSTSPLSILWGCIGSLDMLRY